MINYRIESIGKFKTKKYEYSIWTDCTIEAYDKLQEIYTTTGYGEGSAMKHVLAVFDTIKNKKTTDHWTGGEYGAVLNDLIAALNCMDTHEVKYTDLILKACTYFIRRKGEDKGDWSEALAAEKIEDWKGSTITKLTKEGDEKIGNDFMFFFGIYQDSKSRFKMC